MTERSIFLAALDRPDPAERAAYLDQACAGDPELRRRVEDLLNAHDEPGDSSRTPRHSATPPPGLAMKTRTIDLPQSPIVEGPGSRIGPYKLLQKIGEGGMGTVYHGRAGEAGPPQGRAQDHQAGHGHRARSSPASRPSARPWR